MAKVKAVEQIGLTREITKRKQIVHLFKTNDGLCHIALVILHPSPPGLILVLPPTEQRWVKWCIVLVHRSLDGRQVGLLGHRAGIQEALGGGRGAEGLVLLPVLLLACRSRGGGWSLSSGGEGLSQYMQPCRSPLTCSAAVMDPLAPRALLVSADLAACGAGMLALRSAWRDREQGGDGGACMEP
jgi:hypothetical protein